MPSPPPPSEAKTATDPAGDDGIDAAAPHVENTEGEGGDELRGEAAAAAAVRVRPGGRRGNSRGGAEGTGGSGLEGTARDFQPPAGGGGDSRRESSTSEDMEFPIQSQALPDWADTIKVGGWNPTKGTVKFTLMLHSVPPLVLCLELRPRYLYRSLLLGSLKGSIHGLRPKPFGKC